MLTCPPRWGTPRTPDRPTLGPKVGEVARRLGQPLMEWQQYVADVALEVDPATGRLAYRQIVILVPRQQGKTTLLLSASVHRCRATAAFGGKPQVVTYAAQTRNDARKKWEDDHLPILEASVFGSMFKPRKTNGNEALLWNNRSRYGITSTTKKAGHGETADMGIIDEAWAQTDGRLEQAFKPAMVTKRFGQLWVPSTAGEDKADSPYLWEKVLRGRAAVEAGQNRGIAFFEWSAEDDEDPADPAVWLRTMPALHRPDCPPDCRLHTIDLDTIADDFSTTDLHEFRRAYLNQWPGKKRHIAVIDAVVWQALADPDSQPTGPLWLGVEATPERDTAAISVAALRADGSYHIEVIEHRPGDGVAWVPERLAEIVRVHKAAGTIIDPRSPAGALIEDIEKAGVKLHEITTTGFVQACGRFYDTAAALRLRHRSPSPLDEAVAIVQKRQLESAWAWNRMSGDVTTLVAATLALHGLVTAPAPTARTPLFAVV